MPTLRIRSGVFDAVRVRAAAPSTLRRRAGSSTSLTATPTTAAATSATCCDAPAPMTSLTTTTRGRMVTRQTSRKCSAAAAAAEAVEREEALRAFRGWLRDVVVHHVAWRLSIAEKDRRRDDGGGGGVAGSAADRSAHATGANSMQEALLDALSDDFPFLRTAVPSWDDEVRRFVPPSSGTWSSGTSDGGTKEVKKAAADPSAGGRGSAAGGMTDTSSSPPVDGRIIRGDGKGNFVVVDDTDADDNDDDGNSKTKAKKKTKRKSIYPTWDERLDQCKRYKLRRGHLNIPRDDPQLGKWSIGMKVVHRKLSKGGRTTDLMVGRLYELEVMGFAFDAKVKHAASVGRSIQEAAAKGLAAAMGCADRSLSRGEGAAGVGDGGGAKTGSSSDSRSGTGRPAAVAKVPANPSSSSRGGDGGDDAEIDNGGSSNGSETGDKDETKKRPRPATDESEGVAVSKQSVEMTYDWDERLEQCQRFRERHGHLAIPPTDPLLGKWSMDMRAAHRKLRKGSHLTCYTVERLRLLEAMGFPFGANFAAVTAAATAAAARTAEVPTAAEILRVPVADAARGANHSSSHGGDGMRAQMGSGGRTTNNKDNAMKRSCPVTEEKKGNRKQLKYHGRSWDEWGEMLRQYKSEHGHLCIPKKVPQLGGFSERAKNIYREWLLGKDVDSYTKDQFKKLRKMGFEFAKPRFDIPFERGLELCRDYKAEHGHVRIPIDDKVLGQWAEEMRSLKRRFDEVVFDGLEPEDADDLPDETESQLASLDDIGFSWDLAFDEKLARLGASVFEERLADLTAFGDIDGRSWRSNKYLRRSNKFLH